MNKKRFLHAALALLLIGALAPVSFAAESVPPVSGRTEINGTVIAPLPLPSYSEDVIQVTVPADEDIIVNPYKMEIRRDSEMTAEQVVSPAMTITSTSPLPVTVTASAVGTFQSGAQFVPIPPMPDSAEKELFLYLEFLNNSDGLLPWSGSFTGASNQLVVNGGSSDVLILPAAQDGATVYGAFRAFGVATGAPMEPWSETDAFHVTVSFTFSSCEN